MKNIILYSVLILIIIMPISVKAGVICNDGWESSCTVSGPGCCSHHGGVAENNYNDYVTDGNDYSDEGSDILGIIIFIGIALYFFGIPLFFVIKSLFTNNKL